MQPRPSRPQRPCRPPSLVANPRESRAFRRAGHALWAGLWLVSAACAEPSYKDKEEGGQAESAPDGGAAAARTSDGAAAASEAGPTKTGRDADSPGRLDAESRAQDASSEPLTELPPGVGDASLAGEASTSEPAPDASLPDPQAPSWAPTLLGSFAMQTYTFSAEGSAITTGRVRSLVDIQAGPAGLEMIVRDCDDYSSNAAGTVQVAHPERLPPTRYVVKFQPDSFSTEQVTAAVGYELDAPPACAGKPGERIEKRPFQTWITGSTCKCPGETLPSMEDCRVVDSDDDKLAGYTVIGSAVGLAGTEVYGVTLGVSEFLNGQPSANGGFTAQQQRTVSSLQYDCRPRPCFNLSGTSNSCGPAQSSVVLTPLAGRAAPSGGWSCAAVLSRSGELFPGVPPAMPASCTP